MEKEKLVALVTAAQSGDSDAVSELFSEFYNDLYYFALKTVKNDDTALDVTQDAFVDIINNLGTLKEPAAFVSWAKQITYHQCTRHFKKKTDVLVDEDEDGATIFDNLKEENAEFIPDEALDKDDFKKTILGILDTLPEDQRAAVMMYYFDEMSVREIADIQGVSEGTIKSRLNYARKSIKSSVEEYEKKNGIKLHAIPFFPLFKWLFEGSFSGGGISAAVAEGVSAATGVTVSATAAATTTTAATTVAATTTTAATVGVGAKIAAMPLVAKIVSGIVAAAIVVGTPTTAILLSNKEDGGKKDGSSKPTVSAPADNNDDSLLGGYGGPSFDDHDHEWGESYVYETKKLGVIDIEHKEKSCTICGLIEPVSGDPWVLAANILGDEYYTFLDRYFELGGVSDGDFNLNGLFAAGDFLASEPYHDQESVTVSADSYYANLLQYFELTADTISKMKQERPGDTYTLSFTYNGGGMLATSCIWLRDNIYRVYYTAGTSAHDYGAPFYVDIQYNLHNGEPNKIIGINTDGKAFYDTSRVKNYNFTVKTLLENLALFDKAASYDYDINCLSLNDADYIGKFLRATDIFGYNLTTEEFFGKGWGDIKPEFEGGNLKKITTSFYLPIDYMTSWEIDVNAVRTDMSRRDIDKFIKLVGENNYKLLYNDGEETKEISLSDLTDDMIKSVVSGWDGIGSIRLESLEPIEAEGKSCSFAFTVTPANGLIQNAYFADFEIELS